MSSVNYIYQQQQEINTRIANLLHIVALEYKNACPFSDYENNGYVTQRAQTLQSFLVAFQKEVDDFTSTLLEKTQQQATTVSEFCHFPDPRFYLESNREQNNCNAVPNQSVVTGNEAEMNGGTQTDFREPAYETCWQLVEELGKIALLVQRSHRTSTILDAECQTIKNPLKSKATQSKSLPKPILVNIGSQTEAISPEKRDEQTMTNSLDLFGRTSSSPWGTNNNSNIIAPVQQEPVVNENIGAPKLTGSTSPEGANNGHLRVQLIDSPKWRYFPYLYDEQCQEFIHHRMHSTGLSATKEDYYQRHDPNAVPLEPYQQTMKQDLHLNPIYESPSNHLSRRQQSIVNE